MLTQIRMDKDAFEFLTSITAAVPSPLICMPNPPGGANLTLNSPRPAAGAHQRRPVLPQWFADPCLQG